MNLARKRLQQFQKFIQSELDSQHYAFDKKKPFLPLMVPSYSSEEVLEALDSLLTTNITMGEKVFKFEKMFASYIGRKYGIMVNSGSSANLIAYSSLSNPMAPDRLKSNFKAIIPAIAWSTTLFPVYSSGGKPVLSDVTERSFLLTDTTIAKIPMSNVGLVVPVHLLGNPCDVSAIKRSITENVKIVEDACEAHGAEIHGRKVGSFGQLGTFSFYFSHHITTIEGGMIVTDDEAFADISRMLRAHGWIRESQRASDYAKKYPAIDARFLFANFGYNLRPTELQGAFGIHQLRKLDRFIEARRRNARYLSNQLQEFDSYIELQTEQQNTRHVWFGFPITVKESAPFFRKDLVEFLERNGIQTRPLMSGNLAEQPVASLLKLKTIDPLIQAKRAMRCTFFIGVHQDLDKEALDYIVSTFEAFFKRRTS